MLQSVVYSSSTGLWKVKSPEGESRYSSALSSTLALDGGGWSTPRLGHFTPGKETQYPFYRGWGASGMISTGAENLAPTGIRWAVKPVASRYTDAIQAHFVC
jgi:hypothetical protein